MAIAVEQVASEQVKEDCWFTRVDRGVVVEYILRINNRTFTSRLFRGRADRCSCGILGICQHKKIAMQLEDNWSNEHPIEKPESCQCCGRYAKKINGVALCFACVI